jgi:uncharacterized protein YggE
MMGQQKAWGQKILGQKVLGRGAMRALPAAALSGLAIASTIAAVPASAAIIQIETSGPVAELRITETLQTEPDVAQISAGVVTSAPTASEAMRINARRMDAVIAELKRQGIAERDMQTRNFNVSPQYRYDRQNERQILTGYQVSNSVSVKLRDLDAVGETLDTLAKAGANSISGPRFTLEDNAEVKAEARSAAYARGLAMARDYARLAGYGSVRLLEVTENVATSSRGPQEAVMLTSARSADAVSTPIAAGEVGTSVTIHVKYEMTNPL